MRRFATTALAVLLLTSSALGQKVDLRGPAPKADQTLATTVDTQSEQGTLSMLVQGQAIDGTMATQSHQLAQTKILEVKDGQATKIETTFVEYKTTNKMVMFGQEQVQDDTNLQGMVLTQTLTDNGWETTTKGGALPPEAGELLKKAAYVDPREAFPAEAVGAGHTWKLKDDQIAAFMGQNAMPGTKFKGEIAFKLVEVKAIDGVNIAVIEYDMDGAFVMDMAPQGMQMDININMKGKGLVERNLTNYTNTSVFEGDMKMTMMMSAQGQVLMNMSAKMPIKTESTQEVK